MYSSNHVSCPLCQCFPRWCSQPVTSCNLSNRQVASRYILPPSPVPLLPRNLYPYWMQVGPPKDLTVNKSMMDTSYTLPNLPNANPNDSWLGGPSTLISRIMSFSFLASLFQSQGYALNSLKLVVLGSLIETGRRICQWVMERFQFQYSVTAQFTEGDPTYEWIILFLTKQKIYHRSRDFRVTSASSLRKWSVKLQAPTTSEIAPTAVTSSLPFPLSLILALFSPTSSSAPGNKKTGSLTMAPSPGTKSPDSLSDGQAEYIPTYEAPQLFWWNGYVLEIKRSKGQFGESQSKVIYLTIYTLDMTVLSSVVEASRQLYLETNRPNVIVHSADHPISGPVFTWSHAKRKLRRPLASVILQSGVIDSLLSDTREFLNTEDWYVKAGIPYRRGYLLFGPPGTGKTSTIYALAGELGLEIYSISLASGFVDDSFLQRAVASIPKQAIFLIEDIDCAFPSPRDRGFDDELGFDGYGSRRGGMVMGGMNMSGGMGGVVRQKSNVTLSGLLNVLDGVGSEEGKLFFATTNYVDNLDAALLRPGRIDMKIQYYLATEAQAEALFRRFYPADHTPIATLLPPPSEDNEKSWVPDTQDKQSLLTTLSSLFASSIPNHEFSTAELQGYLLSCKTAPYKAAHGVRAWVDQERAAREAKKQREEERVAKAGEKRKMWEAGRSIAIGPPPVVVGGAVNGPLPALAALPYSPPGTSGQMVGPSVVTPPDTNAQTTATPPPVADGTTVPRSSTNLAPKPVDLFTPAILAQLASFLTAQQALLPGTVPSRNVGPMSTGSGKPILNGFDGSNTNGNLDLDVDRSLPRDGDATVEH